MEPTVTPVDDERRDAVVGSRVDRAGLGEDAVPVGLADPRHPAFGAGEDPVVAVGPGSGAHAHDVAAGLGFGEPEGRSGLTGRDGGDVTALLLLGAGDQQRAGGQAGEEQHERGGVRVLGHFFDGQRQTEDPGAGPSEVLGDAQPGEAGVDEEVEEVQGVLVGVVDLAGARRDALLGELADGGLQLRELG